VYQCIVQVYQCIVQVYQCIVQVYQCIAQVYQWIAQVYQCIVQAYQCIVWCAAALYRPSLCPQEQATSEHITYIMHMAWGCGEGGCACQVQRDSRLRVKEPGAACTTFEKQNWATKARSFCEQRAEGETLPQRRQRMKRAIFTIPRLAAYDVVKGLERALLAGCGHGFEKFDSLRLLEDTGMTAQPVTEDARAALQAMSLPPCVLGVVADQEGKQWAGFNFLEKKLQLNLVPLRDPFHRMWNDFGAAVHKGGFSPVYHHSLFTFNIAYGPFQRSAFFQEMIDMAADLAQTMEGNNPLLLKFWPRILADQGMQDSFGDDTGFAARTRFVERMQLNKSFTIKGPKVSTSRWFSWVRAFDVWDAEWNTKALGLTALALDKAWCLTIEDMMDSLTTEEMPSVEAKGSGSRAKEKDTSKANIDKMRVKAANSLHAVGRLLCDTEFHTKVKLLALCSRPMYSAYSRLVQALRAPRACVQTYIEWSCWRWVEEELKSTYKATPSTHISNYLLAWPRRRIQHASARHLQLHLAGGSDRQGGRRRCM
jgi:hypothetical protein